MTTTPSPSKTHGNYATYFANPLYSKELFSFVLSRRSNDYSANLA